MRLVTIGSVALMALAGPTTGAFAADLGGNCCADLEERIAELEVTTARKGNRKVSLTVYGQVNQAFFYHDLEESGRNSRSVINNTGSTSRIGFKGAAKVNSDVSAGFLIEIGVGSHEKRLSGAEKNTLSVRHSALYVKSKQIGTIWLGQTSQATDGIAEINLGGHSASTMGSLAPFDGATGISELTQVFTSFDGSRAQVVRYISPEMGGFSVSASWSEHDEWDAALRYAGEFGQFRVAAGIGYRQDRNMFGVDDVDGKTLAASGSLMHVPSGLFVAASYGQIKADGDKVSAWAVQGGIKSKAIQAGHTTLYAEYGQGKLSGATEEPNYWGLGISQAVDAAAMDIYLGYRRYSHDGIFDPVDDPTAVVAGAKIKF